MNRTALNTRSAASGAAPVHMTGLGKHPPGMPLKALAAATALALAVISEASFGQSQSIGALDVRSRLGERFYGSVPVRTADGILDPRCIRVVPNPNAPAGAEALQGTRVRIGSADTVIIETAGTVMSPVVGLRLEVGCDNPVGRDFVVLDQGVSVPDLAAPVSAPAVETPAPAVAAAPAARPDAGLRRAPRAVARAPSPRAVDPATDMRAAPAPRVASATPAVPPSAARAPTAAAPTTASAAPAPAPAASAVEAPQSASAAPDTARRVADLRARSDDHAAALLALDDRLALLQKQAELLKAQLEQAFAAAPPASAAAASAATPSSVSAATSAAVAAAASPAPTPAAVSAPAATTTEAPTAKVAPAPSAAPAITSSATSAQVARSQSVLDLLTDWKVAGGIAALLLGALAFKLRRRPTFKPEPAAAATSAAAWPPAALDTTSLHQRTQEVPVFAQAAKAADTAEWQTTTRPLMVDQTAEWVPPPTTDSLPVPESARTQPAALPGAAMTREFHITQQFQPVAERVVALSAPEEIVQQARTHYMEDNDVFKAIDLLEMAVSARKDSPRPWQALFAIYRRENMSERFQRLVLAYRGVFGQDESWPAIRTLGHQMDPTNPLYGDGADAEPIPEDLVERWLGVPLDFTAHLLANEMHDQLMDTYSGRKRRKRSASE